MSGDKYVPYLNFAFKVKICSAIKSSIFLKHKTSTSRIEISDKHNQTKRDSGTSLYEITKWNKQISQVSFILGKLKETELFLLCIHQVA